MPDGDEPTLLALEGVPNAKALLAAIAALLEVSRFESVADSNVVKKLFSTEFGAIEEAGVGGQPSPSARRSL